jgi:hypothetical protein
LYKINLILIFYGGENLKDEKYRGEKRPVRERTPAEL